MSTFLKQKPGESLWDLLISQGKDPRKFGIKPVVSKGEKRVSSIKNKIQVEQYSLKQTVVENDDFKSFIICFYDIFDELIEKYNHTIVNTFLVSLISYINDGKISRRKIYEFINTFDSCDKIRKMTWKTYNYNIKLEDWHHIGGCFSQNISNTFEKTNDTETNGIDGKVCSIFICPIYNINNVDEIYKKYKENGEIKL